MEEVKNNAASAAPVIPGIEFIELLGSGGMSRVYKAKQLKLERIVAVKVLSEQYIIATEDMQRFQNEARLSSALQHPNICKTFAFGVAENNAPYIVMEHLEGLSLAERLEGDPLTLQKFKMIFLSLLSALETSHNAGLLHRDIKPANIMLCDASKNDAEVKLLDFSIAKNVFEGGQAVPNLTQSGVVLGTPKYMSPEQCHGKKLDIRSDLYSLACVMYETLVGQPPFDGESALELMQKHCAQALPSAKSLSSRCGLPVSLFEIVLAGLAKEPNARPSSAAEFSLRLENALRIVDLEMLCGKTMAKRKTLSAKLFGAVVLSSVALAFWAFQAWRSSPSALVRDSQQDSGNSKLTSVSALAQAAEIAFNKKKFGRAEFLLKQCVRKIEERAAPDLVLENKELNLLANCYFLEEKYGEALHYAQDGVKEAEKLAANNRHELLSNSLGIAALAASHLPEPNNAIAYFERGIDETSKAFGDCSPQSLLINRQFADYDLSAGHPKLAMSRYEHCLAISRQLGQAYAIYFSLLATGDCAIKLENYPQAIKYFKEALNMPIVPTPQYARAQLGASCQLAHCYTKLNDLKSAIATYENALASIKSAEIDEDLRMEVLRKLSACYVRMGNYEDGEKVFAQLVAHDSKDSKVNAAVASTDLINLGVARQHSNQWEQAAAAYEKALAIKEKAYGSDNVDVETLREYLGNAYMMQNKFTSAEPVFEKCIVWWKKSPRSAQPFPFKFSVESLIRCYEHTGKPERVAELQGLLGQIK